MNLAVFLSALALVESNGNDSAIGQHGERSKYQITRTVWRQHMAPLSFTKCCWGARAQLCASRHLRWLVKNGVSEYPWDLAYAWNAGRTRYVNLRNDPKSKVSTASSRYAFRVERTYNDLLAKRKAKR